VAAALRQELGDGEDRYRAHVCGVNATNERYLYANFTLKSCTRRSAKPRSRSGDFLAAGDLPAGAGKPNRPALAAGCANDVPRPAQHDISILAGTPEGSGVSGQAFRDRNMAVSNDFPE